MNLAKQVRRLAITLTLSLAVVSLSTGYLEAKPKRPTDNFIRCARYDAATGEWVFYLLGEQYTDANGNTWLCDLTGEWTDFNPTRSGATNLSPVAPSDIAP